MAQLTKGQVFAGGETVTADKLNNLVDNATIANIVDADVSASAAIALSKLATGALPTAITVASANLVDGTIVNADVNASAAIDGTKIAPDFGGQNVVTTGTLGAGATTLGGNLTLGDNNIVAGTTTGIKVGTATTQKVGFWNAAPAVQPAAVADLAVTFTANAPAAADGSITVADGSSPTVGELLEYCVELEAKLEDLLGKLRTIGLIAT